MDYKDSFFFFLMGLSPPGGQSTSSIQASFLPHYETIDYAELTFTDVPGLCNICLRSHIHTPTE